MAIYGVIFSRSDTKEIISSYDETVEIKEGANLAEAMEIVEKRRRALSKRLIKEHACHALFVALVNEKGEAIHWALDNVE